VVKIKLAYPIENGSETVDSIELKRPKGKHLRTFPADPKPSDMLDLASKISVHPKHIYDEMDMKDCMTVISAVGDFLDDGQATGAH
jgi:hypothetical protein